MQKTKVPKITRNEDLALIELFLKGNCSNLIKEQYPELHREKSNFWLVDARHALKSLSISVLLISSLC